ncbi:hypothetical protein [Photobacterium minamisatsumaniensis]|uniref:hypothetical protein n=1 Tax=Photobacterium minamisatsumaniensis TaxID=2910233 RepID=UPI003D0C21D0
MNKPKKQKEALEPCDIKMNPILSTGLLNDELRQQLAGGNVINPSTETPRVESNDNCLSENLNQLVDDMLSNKSLDKKGLDLQLKVIFKQLKMIYTHADISPMYRSRQFISRHGLIISPDNCITSVKDTLRVRAYLRSVHQAVSQLKLDNNSPVHIVYPACGPFAPLLLPLLSYYKTNGLYNGNDIQVTFIDLQPGAVLSLKAVTNELGLHEFIRNFYCQDACKYESSTSINIVVLESLQHGLSREGHVAIARHFARIMDPNGIFLPQDIMLYAVLTVGQKEFIEKWKEENGRACDVSQEIIGCNQRVELGEILRLNTKTLIDLKDYVVDSSTSLIECEEIVIPSESVIPEQPLIIICTQIKVYNEEVLNEYESGITHPLPDMQVCINYTPQDAKPGDLMVKSGDKLKFYYRLNGLPGFMATIAK